MRLAASSLALTLLTVAPFQWFAVAGAKTFRIPCFRDAGAAWGATSFLSGTAVVLWKGLFEGQDPIFGSLGAVLALLSLVLYEWTRRTVGGRGFVIGFGGEVPDGLCEAGPYRYVRHPFYLSYVIAFVGMLVATRTPLATLVFALNVALFCYMARDDERTLATSRLGPQYNAYRQRVGTLLLFPGRRPPV
jgi:protein-S-isoprenylcysteine O-methyltransferase Ste14